MNVFAAKDKPARTMAPDPAHDGFFDAFMPLLASSAEEALAVASAAQALAQERGDEGGVVRALLAEGMAHDALGHAQRDVVLARALEMSQRLGDPVLLLRATNVHVVVDIYRGRYADALMRGQAVLGLAHALQRPDLLGRLLNNLANALANIGEYMMSISLYREWQRLLVGESGETRLNRIRVANNEAIVWWRLAKTYDSRVAAREILDSLERARELAESALLGLLSGDHGNQRLSPLDTLVSVLLDMGQRVRALEWIERAEATCPSDASEPDSQNWDLFAITRSRVELANPGVDPRDVLQRLRAIEALPGPRFRGGEMQAALNTCLADALELAGQHREALAYHRQRLRFEARNQSLWTREHAMAVRHTLDSLRGETEEFITHDLRNPLGAALVQMDALAAGRDMGPPARQALARARGQVQRAIDAADFHLIIARVRNLRRSALGSFDLAELVDDVCERLAPPAGATIRLEREIEWGCEIRGDRISLLAALDYLLRTILEAASPHSEVTWRLSCDGGRVTLAIIGDGEGWARWLTGSPIGRVGTGPVAFDSKDLAQTMVARVVQLHDSRIEAVGPAEAPFQLRWDFPLRVS